MQVFREQMIIRTNGNLGVDFVTLAPKMGSHLFETVLYFDVPGSVNGRNFLMFGICKDDSNSGNRLTDGEMSVIRPNPFARIFYEEF